MLLLLPLNILVRIFNPVLWLHTKTHVVDDVHKPSTRFVPVTNNIYTSDKESSPNPVLVSKE
jgi:hypothetical protein